MLGQSQRRKGQDGIARHPRDQERSINRVLSDGGKDEHQQVESHQRSGGDNASTVSQDDQYLLLAKAIIA